MTTAATLLTSVLAMAPSSDSSSPRVDRVETTTFDNAAEIIAYDDTGEVYAVLVLQTEPDGRVRMDVDFDDGLYLSVLSDGEAAEVDTNDSEEVGARMLMIQSALEEPAELPQWMECAGTVVLAGVACVPPLGVVGFAGCAGASFMAGCACAETFVDGKGSCWD